MVAVWAALKADLSDVELAASTVDLLVEYWALWTADLSELKMAAKMVLKLVVVRAVLTVYW